ncbi:hypothetical protein IG197_05400 [Aminobacter sp. SR38]|jgi:hypothetical protein|uniref:hypothetical protein n=1 Tax=Aminobacter sp. SR38 TaxID=2774562 RepID=UPI001780E711|nr:hypothetical protein [Aminobacter sp. SR38]QOF72515.1 hypothetical protein IG197_05400 [Aminobacter sp. SR38]
MSCDEDRYLTNAAMALGDEFAARKCREAPTPAQTFAPRRALRRARLALTSPHAAAPVQRDAKLDWQ